MKKIILLITSFTLAATLNAQNVNYKILRDDPQNFHPKLNINLIVGGMEMGVSNIDALHFYFGAQGSYMVNDRIGVQAHYNHSMITLGKLRFKEYPTPKEFSVGGLFFLRNSSKTKNVKVDLKVDRSTGSDGREYQSTTYIMVPGTKQIFTGVRGGLFIKNGPYSLDNLKIAEFEAKDMDFGSYTTIGLYGGIIRRQLTNLYIDADSWGKKQNSLGQELYADVLLSASTSFSHIALGGNKTDVSTTVINNAKSSPIGFRVGWTGYQIAPKDVSGKKFGMSFNFEGGLMPYQGWFVKGGVGLTLVKKPTITVAK